LAAISLMALTTWLARAGRPLWFTAVPCVFMCCTTLTMLVRLLLLDYIPNWREKWPLLAFDILILGLTAVILTNGLRALFVWFRPASSTPSALPASR
ncbi:MAG TPA: carbon starvation CstA 5TM domain-containing protein, partial [Planctomycetaceae bacterium]|nr:carbon starvation CstA 5TM domain-containing protein [Planctomycetaceae bacterium]